MAFYVVGGSDTIGHETVGIFSFSQLNDGSMVFLMRPQEHRSDFSLNIAQKV